jgi:hypothetical protein
VQTVPQCVGIAPAIALAHKSGTGGRTGRYLRISWKIILRDEEE